MSKVHKILSLALLIFFLGTMFFFLFYMSMGMDISGGMTDCPFVSHEEVMCPMNLADHIGAWKSVFLSTVPTLTLFLAVAGLVILAASAAPNLLRKIPYTSLLLPRCLEVRTYTFSHRPLQELFSSGILHPKVF